MTPRAKVLLIVLCIAAFGMLWKRLGPSSAPAAASVSAREGASRVTPLGRARAGESGAAAIKDASGLSQLRLAELDATPPSFKVGRNPFAFVAPPPPPPPPPPPQPSREELEAKAAAARALREAQEQARAREEAIPKPPAITFSYIGSFGPVNRRIAVLSDGPNTYNAMVGDVIEGKFRLEAIGFESIDIGFVDFPNLPAVQLPVGEEGGS